jgi:hypothetical protein
VGNNHYAAKPKGQARDLIFYFTGTTKTVEDIIITAY